MRRSLLVLVLIVGLFPAAMAFGQEGGTFDRVTTEMRALRATFLSGVNQETCASMLLNVAKLKELLEKLFGETVGVAQSQADLISALDRDLELLRFQLVNAVNESTGVAVSLKIVLEDYIKLRDARNGK